MSATVTEHGKGWQMSVGGNSSRSRLYTINGADSEYDAAVALQGYAAANIGIYFANDWDVTQIADRVYRGTVTYLPWRGDRPDNNGDMDTGVSYGTIEGTTAGDMIHITRGITCKANYGIGTPSAPHAALNVRKVNSVYDVQGIDIPDRGLNFIVRKSVGKSVFTGSFLLMCYNKSQKINASSYTVSAGGLSLTFSAEELKFNHLEWQENRQGGYYELAWHFTAIPSIVIYKDDTPDVDGNTIEGTNLSDDFVKNGHDWIEFEFSPKQDPTTSLLVPKPVHARTVQVFYKTSFSGLIPASTN